MWLIVLYFIPNFDVLERKLQQMESKGYIVYMVVFDFIFIFRKKNKANTGSYFAIKYLFRDFDCHLNNVRCELCTMYKAQPIKTKYSGLELYRVPITLDEEYFSRCITIRNIYFIRVMKQELVLGAYFLICFIILVVFSNKNRMFFLLGTIMIVLFMLWRIICLVKMNNILYKKE